MSVKGFANAKLLALTVGFMIGAPLGAAAPLPASANASNAIRLQAGTFRPGLGERPRLPPGLSVAEYAEGRTGYYIVQFSGPVRSDWKTELEAAGAELLHYVPDFAFKVRMNPAEARSVASLASVAWVGLFQPAFKLSNRLSANETGLYRIRIERGADAGQTRAAVLRSGARFLRGSGQTLIVAAEAAQLIAIANVLDVAWIENFTIHERLNEYGAGVIMGANAANNSGYDGSTQTIAVADTGLGDGTAIGAHASLTGRVTAVHDWPGGNAAFCYTTIPDGARDVDSGHGTHTAVSTAGAGNGAGEGKGTAPASSLVFQAVEDYADMSGQCSHYPDGYYLLGLPADLHDLYLQAYRDGARIHSNSWGSETAGEYTADSADTDDFIWANPDMVITFSAGNAGADDNGNGTVDSDSTGSPATAKNVITVGASENDRSGNWNCDRYVSYGTCGSQGGQNSIFTYGAAWPDDFPANPIASDPSAGNAQQMAAFSSRGPTDDGRIKPDVVAPGTWVLSGYSALFQESYDGNSNPQNGLYQYDGWGYPVDDQYKYMGGTSMSNPLVAGAAAVTRDYYQKAHGHSASAALVKATLINSAVDLLDENNDGANDNDYPIPNIHEGWGRVNLAAAVDGGHEFVDEASGLSTGETSVYPYNVESSSALKVSLVWSDYASSETASVNLVNDLDLKIISPDGTTYLGNVFSGGWSSTGGSADRRNNVENVYLPTAAAGNWIVEIIGYNLPQGPQPYALIVDGAGGGTSPPSNQVPDVGLQSPAEAAAINGIVTLQIVASDAEDTAGTLSVEWNIDDGAWTDTGYNGNNGYYEAAWDTTAFADGEHAINVRASDSGGQSATDTTSVTVDNVVDPPPVTFSVGDLDASSLPGNKGSWIARVDVTVRDLTGAIVEGAIVEGAWSNGANGSGSCTTSSGGSCSVTKGVRNRFPGVDFTVSNITHAAGTYDPGANSDPDGDSDGTTITVPQDGAIEPPPPPPPPPWGEKIHVGDLDGAATANRSRWDAQVTVTVHGTTEGVVPSVTVSGNWSSGGGGNCTTNTSGHCTIARKNLKSNVGSVTFAVSDIADAAATYSYGATDNHDPEGDSDGSAITVSRP